MQFICVTHYLCHIIICVVVSCSTPVFYVSKKNDVLKLQCVK